MPKEQVKLDVTNPANFVFDMSRCIKCKGCTWVDHVYMPGVKYSTRCPSATRYQFDSYGAYGKMRIGVALLEGRLEYSDTLLKILYACTLCGACDVGCKRNLDLEIELALESLRIKAVKDGKAPLPAHKNMARNIVEKHNSFGLDNKYKRAWLSDGIKPAPKADVLYFAGCAASLTHPEIARATAKIIDVSGASFMLLPDEICCGNKPYSVGMIDEARALAQCNVDAVRQTGASTLLVSCAECYRMWKVDYPKMFNISTADLGFKVMHLTEYVDEQVKIGNLKLDHPVDLRLTYHDPCSLSRLSEPWVPWEGERGLWGTVNPPIERRRGTHGVYQPPRDVIKSIPGVELAEMPRMRENAFCCGAGRATREAFPDFAAWAVEQRLVEVKEVGAEAVVSACPWCKENFSHAVSQGRANVKVLDFSELVLSAVSSRN